MARKNRVTVPNSVALRVPGIAEMLACSERAAERLIQTGELKSFRVGRMRLVRRAAIEEFCATREKSAKAS